MKKYTPYILSKDKDIPYLESILFGENGLEVHCEFKDNKKKIIFEYCLSYRLMEEGNALVTLDEQDFSGEAWMFYTTKSQFLHWFNNESYHIHEGEVIHYIIASQGYLIDILSKEKPRVLNG